MIRDWSVRQVENPTSCIIALAGRSNPAEIMRELCTDMELHRTVIVAFRPINYEWYPAPVSSVNQDEAVEGLPRARSAIQSNVERVQRAFNLKPQQIALLGFSAGAVMALDVAVRSPGPFAAVVGIGGAILEPWTVPKCKHPDMPFLLLHNQDDFCFDWKERYLPMKNALLNNGYSVTPIERATGGHGISKRGMFIMSHFLAPNLGYESDWVHPEMRN